MQFNNLVAKKAYKNKNCHFKNKINKQSNDTEDVIEKNTATVNFSMLHDDCMEHILELLNLRDQIRLSQSCTSLRNAFVNYSKIRYKTVFLSELTMLNLSELHDFFQLVGQFIIHIVIVGGTPINREPIIDLIAKNCKYVVQLHLEKTKLKIKSFNRLFFEMKNIADLSLANCYLSDASIVTLRKLSNLKKLNLDNNCQLTGKHLNKLPNNLESLSLSCCYKLETKEIIAFCKSLVNLKDINIIGCSMYNGSTVYQAIYTHCKLLEMLKINTANGEIAKLPKLKHLVLEILSNDLLLQLVRHKDEKLECLEILKGNSVNEHVAVQVSQLYALRVLICPNNYHLNDVAIEYYTVGLLNLEKIVLNGCTQITNTAVLQLALACKKLQLIGLQGCTMLNDSLIFELIRELRKQNHRSSQRKKPIELLLYKTKINECILNNPAYITSNDLLRIYFKKLPQELLAYAETANSSIEDELLVEDLYPTENDDFELYSNSF